jgi:hypothetical protein
MCDLKGYTYRRRNDLLDEALRNERELMIKAKIQRRKARKEKQRFRDRYCLTITALTLGMAAFGFIKTVHSAPVTDLEVFTTSAFPIGLTDMPDVNLKVYNLDQLQQSIAQVDQELQSMSTLDAETGAKQLLLGQIPLLRDQFHGLALAQQYGIQQLPTIVFDHGKAESVGITDLGIAVLDYQAWSNLK